MRSNRDRIVEHVAWLERRNSAPLNAPFAVMDHRPPGTAGIAFCHDLDTWAATIDRCIDHGDPSPNLVQQRVDTGPAFLPALAGAGFAHDEHTSWSLPCAESACDFTIGPFDPGHPLLARYRSYLEKILARWSWETFLPGMADVLGPMDILAGCLGPETLSMELIEEPAAVRDRSLEAAQLIIDYLHWEWDMHRSAGLTEGCTEAFSLWMPGRGVRLSEDFSALVGPDHFAAFFIEPDSMVCRACDTAIMHTHSSAWRNMGGFLAIDNLQAIEIGNDPNGPDLATRIAVARDIQAAGKALLFGSWQIPLPAADVALAYEQLDHHGLYCRFQAADAADFAFLSTIGQGDERQPLAAQPPRTRAMT